MPCSGRCLNPFPVRLRSSLGVPKKGEEDMKTMIAWLAALAAALPTAAGAVGRLADLTVYDRSEGRMLPVYWHEGRAYVVGTPGHEYQLSVRSRQGEPLLAVLSVDGVNVVSGETASPQQSGYVLSPWRQLDVRGWRKSLDRTAAFYFTSLPDSYAARTGRPDHVGAIGIALFRQKSLPPVPSEIAPLARNAPSTSDAKRAEAASGALGAPQAAEREDRLGTGHGRQEHSLARYVGFERASHHPAEMTVLYYDSCRNLVARGVIPPTAAPCSPPRSPRPVPNPFPGFAADPPA
jgi:hypothetical protein